MPSFTGLYSCTSGKAIVNGYDINTSIEKIRGKLGLCPQHNMLFPILTVREHLFFFGMVCLSMFLCSSLVVFNLIGLFQLKGLGYKEALSQADVVADQVMLGEKKNKKSSTLSGGMKRKLHLGISLIGESSVVLLDEPTSGMQMTVGTKKNIKKSYCCQNCKKSVGFVIS